MEVGLPIEALGLMEIPIPLARGQYLALYAIGVRSTEDFWSLPWERIKEVLADSIAFEVEKVRLSRSQ